MFRFFCTKCLKVKRVQSPDRVVDLKNQHSDKPTSRTGKCMRHFEKINVRVRPTPKSKPAVVTSIKSKRGK